MEQFAGVGHWTTCIRLLGDYGLGNVEVFLI